jgi:Homeodomain-like domain-containing protein
MRGRRMVIAWQDDEAALYQRYRAEPDAEVRTRWHALWLIRQGRTATEAATLVGVERRSVQRWLAW